jgi:hypothetical protein
MLYAIAHFFRDNMPWLWDLIDVLNSFLFTVRYGRRLRLISSEGIIIKGLPSKFKIVPIREIPTEQLVAFFAHQPEEAFEFFKPHGFDAKSIKKLQRNKAFLAYVLLDGHQISGYCFNRSFFHGKGFRGRMVDIDYRGMGLGTMMNRILNEVGFGIGLRLFETVNKDNIASYRSAMSASNVRILEELDGKDLYLEILKV